MADLRQSSAFAKYITSLGWIVEKNIFIRPLWIFGAIAKVRRGKLPKNWKAILKKHHVWLLKIDNSPTKTLRIDLTPSLKNILAQFKKDCRYNLRKVTSDKYQVTSNNFINFYEIWKKSARRKNLWIPSEKDYSSLIKCFGKNAFCITINNEAGALILIHDNIAYYYYAGATAEGTKQNLPYSVVWKCIQEAKKRKCKFWDFEGIYDDRHPNKDWLGFSHFKKSFGGTEVQFPMSHNIWNSQFWQ
ncbi:MAG: peptidoglycan bridge formation glycyltransferase FemA/FemB family protein [Patescibacteria group bacterium]